KIGEHIIPHPSVRRTQPRNWNARTPCVLFMSSDRTIVDAIKVAQDLLGQNLPPTHNLTDAATVMRFRELVRSQAIRSALDRSSDTLLTFALREVERVICDQSRTNRETIISFGTSSTTHISTTRWDSRKTRG